MKKIHFAIKPNNHNFYKFFKKNSLFLPFRSNIQKLFVEQIANNIASRLLDSATSKKTFDWWITLAIPAKTASLLPPVGPFLGQHGFNTMTFCSTFNNLTKDYPESLPIKVIIKLYTDKSIQFQLKTPPVSFLLLSSYLNNFEKLKKQDLLKILILKKLELPNISTLSMVSSLLGTFWSFKLRL